MATLSPWLQASMADMHGQATLARMSGMSLAPWPYPPTIQRVVCMHWCAVPEVMGFPQLSYKATPDAMERWVSRLQK